MRPPVPFANGLFLGAEDRRIWPIASDWYVSRQVAATSGFRSSREHPAETAERFAVESLGWARNDVGSLVLDGRGGWWDTVVAVWNERLAIEGLRPPLTVVTVAREVICLLSSQRGCNGLTPTRHWTVVSVDCALVELDQGRTGFDGGDLQIGASFAGNPGGRHLEIEVSDGAAGDEPPRWLRLEESITDPGRSLSVWGLDRTGWVTALVSLVDDATGRRLAADAFPWWIPIPEAAS
jgi:hypothetical protein